MFTNVFSSFWTQQTQPSFTRGKKPEELKGLCQCACVCVSVFVCESLFSPDMTEAQTESLPVLCFSLHRTSSSGGESKLLVRHKVYHLHVWAPEAWESWHVSCDKEACWRGISTAGWILLWFVFTAEKSAEVTFLHSPFLPPTIPLYLSHQASQGEAWETLTSPFLWHKDPLWDPFTIFFLSNKSGKRSCVHTQHVETCPPEIQPWAE